MNDTDLSKKTISVIISTKNEERVIHDCLSSVFNQSLEPLEVIVVDGRSTDGTLQKAQEFPVKIISEEEPTSLPNSRNLGINSAQGEVILLMDADTILDKNCAENAVKYFKDPNIIAVIPSEENVPHTRLERIQLEWERGTANSFRSGIGISVFTEFLRKSIFDKIKFNTDLGYGEDEDFQQKLKQFYRGPGKIIHASDAKISAHTIHTISEFCARYTWYGRTFTKYFSTRPSAKTFLNLGSILAPAILLILGFLTVFILPILPFFIIIAALLIARNLIVCYRSKSIDFIEFVGFEFLRSLFFVFGIIQGIFSRRRGK
jgi:glycosyltransferase involved in cell wall biosynthesis